jgi:multidrug efflux pump subunit AcrB
VNKSGEFPLIEIADFNVKRGVVSINHLDGKREIKVEADIANKKVSVTDITSKLKNEIIPKIANDYPSVSFRFEGQNKENEKSAKSIQANAPLILIVMFLIIAITFGSLGQAGVVFLTIPFGFIGVAWGHWFLDAPISFFSILGVIALIGIMVNDSLVFVAAYNDNIKNGLSTNEAAYNAGISRFRAICLTSLTTILGLGPLILEKSVQAQFLIPMAISIAFGLLLATVITLLLLPTLILLHNRYKWLLASAWEWKWVKEEEVESALPNRKNYFWLWLIPVSPFIFMVIKAILF